MAEIHSKVMRSVAPQEATPDFNLGTGWGKEKDEKVDLKEFERGRELAEMVIYYTNARGLKRAGVDLGKTAAVTKPALPQGFNGFCVPPKTTST
jgi:hypothetical protein